MAEVLLLSSREHGWPPIEISPVGMYRAPGARHHGYLRAEIPPGPERLGGTVVLRQRGSSRWRRLRPGRPVEVEVWMGTHLDSLFTGDVFEQPRGTSIGELVEVHEGQESEQ